MLCDLSHIIKQKGSGVIVEEIDMTNAGLLKSFEGFTLSNLMPFSIRVNVDDSEILISGSSKAAFSCSCDRCLKDMTIDVPFAIDEKLKIGDNGIESDPDDPKSYVADDSLDISELISLQLLLMLPTKVLCSDDCKGLCPVCGANLNICECGCDRQIRDPRMMQFLDVFNNKEV